ncbi:Bro-N domain-containing protein [Candidatus Woesearchaeota archaeon]|nr:Bro-N domain-containing protein [Candidatus Woesearchaeota archaeon]
MDKSLVVFEGKDIRRTIFNNEWYYSVIDIIAILIEQEDFQTSRKYWNKLSQRLREEGSEVVTNCHQLKLLASDGKLRETDCANTKSMFRIIQSIPSKKAEPLKLWLAQVGYERIQEIENPELAQDRAKEYYELKGYPQDWIEKRLRGIAIRQDLTEEWKNRGIREERDFAILTNEISKATFGKTVNEYKQFKGLNKPNQNLRDHMNDWELIFTMLGEKATIDITKTRNARGFDENKMAAKRGGQIAENARKELEQETGKSVVSEKNYLNLNEKKRRKMLK